MVGSVKDRSAKMKVFNDVVRTSSGRWYAAGTTGSRNFLYEVEKWRKVAEWKGCQMTACGSVGETIICPALDGINYLFRDGAILTLEHSDKRAWINGVLALDEQTALLVGNTGVYFTLDCATLQLTRSRLRDSQIEKPGRDLLSVRRLKTEIIATGTKELLLQWRESGWINLLPGRSGPMFFWDAIAVGDTIWISAVQGQNAFLGALNRKSPSVDYYPLPLSGIDAPILDYCNDNFILAGESILIGKPGKWQVHAGFSGGGAAGIIRNPGESRICIIGDGGEKIFISPRNA
ncbi:MAG: hypothetical protein AB1813_03070 [Verrucomicrobiota bacterium]